MHVTVFSAKRYDRASFERANARFDHELDFVDARLSPATAGLAVAGSVVCAFVNDDLGREVLTELAGHGVHHIALRLSLIHI